MQPKLPLRGLGLKYECLNPDCFYCGSLMGVHEVRWVHFWNSQIEDLDLRSTCPSCHDPLAIWDDDTDDALTSVVNESL